MEKELTPFEQLDKVLKFIKQWNKENPYFCSDTDLAEFFGKSSVIKMNMGAILGKLLKDDYITISEVTKGLIYVLTFEGEMLLLQGGYEQEQKDIIVARSEIAKTQNVTLRNEKYLMVGTWVASFVGLFLLIFEALKYSLDLFLKILFFLCNH